NKLIATTIGLALVITVSVLGTAYTQSAFATLTITTNGGGGGGGAIYGNGGNIAVTGSTTTSGAISGGGNTVNHGNVNGGDANGGRGGDAGVTVRGTCNHSSTC
ncbi:MAG: hypothetical protein WA667_23760, partial [Candidatus Nitrosopolaris sp.]